MWTTDARTRAPFSRFLIERGVRIEKAYVPTFFAIADGVSYHRGLMILQQVLDDPFARYYRWETRTAVVERIRRSRAVR